MSRRHPHSLVTGLVIACGLLVGATAATAPSGRGGIGAPVLRPPTEAPVLDPFRLPDGPYGAGNRGIEYDTAPADPVRAAAAGRVSFAGPVAGALFVTIDHGAGLETTYGFVATLAVAAGDRVDVGRLVARAGGPFHFGVRLDGRYVDPARLLARRVVRVRLVPGPRSASDAGPVGSGVPEWAGAERTRQMGARAVAGIRRFVEAGPASSPATLPDGPNRAPDGARSASTDALRLVPSPVASASGTSSQPGRNPWQSSP